jgi:hypothetical protein
VGQAKARQHRDPTFSTLANGVKVYKIETGGVLPKLKPTTSNRRAMRSDGQHYLMLIGIFSPPNGFERRMGQRESWINNYRSGKFGDQVRHWYLVGRSGNDEIDSKLEEENSIFQDMIIFDWKDSFDMLTVKYSFVGDIITKALSKGH